MYFFYSLFNRRLLGHGFNFFLTESETQSGRLRIPTTTIAAVEVNGRRKGAFVNSSLLTTTFPWDMSKKPAKIMSRRRSKKLCTAKWSRRHLKHVISILQSMLNVLQEGHYLLFGNAANKQKNWMNAFISTLMTPFWKKWRKNTLFNKRRNDQWDFEVCSLWWMPCLSSEFRDSAAK